MSYRTADFVLCWLVFCAFGLVFSAHHVKRLTAVKNIPEMAYRCVMLTLTQSIKLNKLTSSSYKRSFDDDHN